MREAYFDEDDYRQIELVCDEASESLPLRPAG
jgi:hypothetical protein